MEPRVSLITLGVPDLKRATRADRESYSGYFTDPDGFL